MNPKIFVHLFLCVSVNFYTLHKCTIHISLPPVSLKEDGTKEVSESKHILTLIVAYLFKIAI